MPAETSPDTTSNARLSDVILVGLNMAIAQRDTATADILLRALEVALTRHTGGPNFVERRSYPPAITKAIADLEALKSS